MDGKEEVKRGNLEEHYEEWKEDKDVELAGELYDVEYKMPMFGTWLDLLKMDGAAQKMELIKVMEPKLGGVTVDFERLRNPKLGTAVMKFCVDKMGGGEKSKN